MKGDLPLPILTPLPPPPPPPPLFTLLEGTFQGEAFCSRAMTGSFSTSDGGKEDNNILV